MTGGVLNAVVEPWVVHATATQSLWTPDQFEPFVRRKGRGRGIRSRAAQFGLESREAEPNPPTSQLREWTPTRERLREPWQRQKMHWEGDADSGWDLTQRYQTSAVMFTLEDMKQCHGESVHPIDFRKTEPRKQPVNLVSSAGTPKFAEMSPSMCDN